MTLAVPIIGIIGIIAGVIFILIGKKYLKMSETPATEAQTEMLINGELPFGWIYRNKDFTDQISRESNYFRNCWIASRTKHPKEYYSALKSFVIYLEDCRSACSSMGECHLKWFQDIIADDEYIDARKSELQELEININQLSDNYTMHQNNIQGLEQKVLDCIKQHEGILQKDIYAYFDASVKDDVSEKLYFLSKLGKIERIKKGNTYILHSK